MATSLNGKPPSLIVIDCSDVGGDVKSGGKDCTVHLVYPGNPLRGTEPIRRSVKLDEVKIGDGVGVETVGWERLGELEGYSKDWRDPAVQAMAISRPKRGSGTVMDMYRKGEWEAPFGSPKNKDVIDNLTVEVVEPGLGGAAPRTGWAKPDDSRPRFTLKEDIDLFIGKLVNEVGFKRAMRAFDGQVTAGRYQDAVEDIAYNWSADDIRSVFSSLEMFDERAPTWAMIAGMRESSDRR